MLCCPLPTFYRITLLPQIPLELLDSRDTSVVAVRNDNVGPLVPSATAQLVLIVQ